MILTVFRRSFLLRVGVSENLSLRGLQKGPFFHIVVDCSQHFKATSSTALIRERVSNMSSPYTLYHCVAARSFRALWMLEELRAPYALKVLPFPPRVHRKDYLKINPLGTIPCFVDESNGSRMTESAAITEYLAAKHAPTPLAVLPDEQGFADYLNFLHFGEATLTFPQTLVLRYGLFEPPERRDLRVARDYAKWFLARLRTLTPVLSERTYLAANRFTAADISVGYALLLAEQNGLESGFPAQISGYWDALKNRDAFKRAVEREAEEAVKQGVDPESPIKRVEL